MTPFQYHFPHFLEIEKLNQELHPFNLSAHLFIDHDQKDAEYLAIGTRKQDSNTSPSQNLLFPYGTFLMIQNSSLFTWQKYHEGLEIRKYDLTHQDIHSSMKSDLVNILKCSPGKHLHADKLQFDHFITFSRKENLITPDESFEKYVIVHLNKYHLTIIPFDEFNETGGDPMYKWPALATLDLNSGKLHGIGMRMGTFTIQLPELQ
ncbi:MAG TPA: hypothetical protein VFG10_08165 [Saprospiraceae bacterium]|nr:hypothetical protein [Saprospiraceae bacterium]